MIRPLRRAHRVLVTVLAVALPLAFVQALRGRNPVPPSAALPAAALGDEPAAGSLPLRVGLVARDGVRLQHRVFDAGRLAVEVLVEPAGVAPDALLYWSERASDGETLPEHAQLLGRLAGAWRPRFPLPEGARGWLVVYSLAHQRVVIEAELIGGSE